MLGLPINAFIMVRLLGVDPGSRKAGFAILEVAKASLTHRRHGVIQLNEKKAFNLRLADLLDVFQRLIAEERPDVLVIEKIFLAKNADSAFKLGHARGVILAAAAQARCEIFEYEPRLVKRGITGNGGASKEEVERTLLALLRLPSIVNSDAADALSLAYFHSQMWIQSQKIQRLVET